MYTQCPECGVAFRVTADVLKQAAGKVRCGGCGIAFNALEHLSESKPDAPEQRAAGADSALPELTPDAPAELEADTPPESISAEQSAALLKTLDQLAGEDVRIEDTGVEWRVIDDDEIADEPPAESQPSQVIDEMRFDDNTPLPDDFDYISESTPAPAPANEPDTEPEPEPEVAQVDLAFGEPDEWEDLLGDIDEPVTADVDEALEVADAVGADEEEIIAADEPEPDIDQPLDMDTQFALQAEAMGIDLSGLHETGEGEPEELELELEAEDDEHETSIEEDLIAAAFEAEAAVKETEDPGARAALEEPEAAEEPDEEPESEPEEAVDDEQSPEMEIDLQIEDEEEGEDDVEDIAMAFDDKVEEVIETIAASFDGEDDEVIAGLDDLPTDFDDDVESTAENTVIPEMSEEEKTINRMIDQELLAIAVEDDEGFASTIAQKQPDDDADEGVDRKKAGKKDKKKGKKDKKKKDKKADKEKAESPASPDSPAVFETIVMEGEYVRDVLDTPPGDDPGDHGISIPLSNVKDDYARRGEIDHSRPRAGMIAGVVALFLVLLVQVIHYSRDALATVPAFNATVGPIYRMLGMPLTPTWNIQGWRFEATKGDVDETGQLLTIYSRVGNKSDESLPYPLVHLSLTDRFEESIGSTVLEPADYLPENADPRRLVPPGNTFNAVISIESPSPDATSFKLNVCYRLASGMLRCQDESFK